MIGIIYQSSVFEFPFVNAILQGIIPKLEDFITFDNLVLRNY